MEQQNECGQLKRRAFSHASLCIAPLLAMLPAAYAHRAPEGLHLKCLPGGPLQPQQDVQHTKTLHMSVSLLRSRRAAPQVFARGH